MIQITSMTPERLEEVSDSIAAAFLNYSGENGSLGIFPSLHVRQPQVKRYMKAVLRYALKTHQLYAVSEQGEGYCVMCESFEEEEPLIASFRLFLEEIAALGISAYSQFSLMFMNAGESEESRFRREKKNFIGIALLAVPEPFQHQGNMRRMLEDVFAMADEKQLPVLLETDTEAKMKRYCHLGMQCSGQRDMGFGCTYYHLIRYPADRIQGDKQV